MLVANEINHYQAQKYGGSVGHATLKLNLSKAYDRAKVNGELRGVAVSRHGPRVSHLSFVDNTLIFCQVTSEALQCAGRVLSLFEKASGLKVNLEKSSVAFSRNTSNACRLALTDILSVQVVGRHGKYLGLPDGEGRSKNAIFQHLKDWVWAKLQSWECKNLSQAGKVVVLKTVVQSIPVYAMRCFQVPLSTCRKIEGIMADFLWHNNGVRRIHWLAWNKLCECFSNEGLDYRGFLVENRFRATCPDMVSDEFLGQSPLRLDLLRWHFEKHGDYSGRSGYNLVLQGVVSGFSLGSSSSKPSSWNFVWKAAVPPKCHFARLVWALSTIPWGYVNGDHNDPEVWFQGLHRNLDAITFGCALLICWFLMWM
ncbi:hypothetical protein Sango_2488500 [Sesamum angolense]|uniref:Uncharacterized protein n=1 Tax=Sesamum angolense TaxID=2727404 RepID=A0AAE2BI18_9LAMI|nr:hypothetical protein Sango_2488500 [Sesamum angolense]